MIVPSLVKKPAMITRARNRKTMPPISRRSGGDADADALSLFDVRVVLFLVLGAAFFFEPLVLLAITHSFRKKHVCGGYCRQKITVRIMLSTPTTQQ